MEPDNHLYKSLLDNMYCGVYFVDMERRITYWNTEAERITGFTAPEVMGTHCWKNLLMHVDNFGNNLSHGQCPLAETLRDGQLREAEVHLRHKAGHRVSAMIRAAPILDSQGQVTGAVEVFLPSSQVLDMLQKDSRLQRMNLFDPLTNTGNRKYVELSLYSRIEAMQRFGWPFGLLIARIDGLQAIREARGAEAADQTVRMVAHTLQNTSRPFDVLGRWDDESFVAMVENPTQDQLYGVAKRYRALVEKSSAMVGAQALHATISIGGTLAKTSDTSETLLERAERLVKESVSSGGNRLAIASSA